MAYSVLILDDDADFNSLLTDIFEQADYIVTPLLDPIEAIEVFKNTDFDLVVTDHKMPDMTGMEFMAEIKKLKPETPVIMVSGYLENRTIRDLISGGVGGVFLKPLNIFSLLERTSELIDEAKHIQQSVETTFTATPGQPTDVVENNTDLAFSFRSFPCKSQKSADFAERLYNLRNFKSTLSLIGEPGTQFRLICEDMRGFYSSEDDHFLYFSVGSFDAEQVCSMLEEAKLAGAQRVTCVLLDVESMSDKQKLLAVSLSKSEGVFESLDVPCRTVFCANGDLDSLFDEGRIDEELYILMGMAEVCVPALSECPSDIPVLAQQMVVDFLGEKGLDAVCRFEASARDFISKHHWNYEQLQATVRKVMDADPTDVLTLAAVTSALRSIVASSPRGRLEASLSAMRIDYVRAVLMLCGDDQAATAAFFGTDTTVIKATLK
jgi:DNA-binding NtrC family response regulator